MHELSIAMSIVDAAAEEAARLGARRISAVHLRLGPLSGVVKEALLFSYGLVCDGTPLAGSRLLVEDVPVLAYCEQCREPREIQSLQRFTCSVCGTLTAQVLQGKELLVTALEIEQ
jgi:hydrogenase nickel incorporation protein HypA/HybF